MPIICPLEKIPPLESQCRVEPFCNLGVHSPECIRPPERTLLTNGKCGLSGRLSNGGFPHNPVLTLNIAADNYPQDGCLDWLPSLRDSPIGAHLFRRMSQRRLS